MESKLRLLWQIAEEAQLKCARTRRSLQCPAIRHSFPGAQGEVFLGWVEAVRSNANASKVPEPGRYHTRKQNKPLSLPGWSEAITLAAS